MFNRRYIDSFMACFCFSIVMLVFGRENMHFFPYKPSSEGFLRGFYEKLQERQTNFLPLGVVSGEKDMRAAHQIGGFHV